MISNIVPCGDSKKEKAEAVNKLLVDICEQKEIPLIDHGNISTKRHLNKSRLHLNAHGKSVFVKNLRKPGITENNRITSGITEIK